MLVPASDPSNFDDAARFRLAGYGGAAIFLRTQLVPGPVLGTEGVAIAFDVTLLAPAYHASYLTRPGSDHAVDWLASFLLSAASDIAPEETVHPFSDPAMGLTIRVLSSTDERAELEVRVLTDVDEPDGEVDLLNFETSRYALAAAAEAVRVLDGSWGIAEIDEEFRS